MKRAFSLIFLSILIWPTNVRAEVSLAALDSGRSYQEVKIWHQQFIAGNPGVAERLDTFRAIVSSSPYGKRGLNRIFGNFEGRHSIDPRIPGVEESVLKVRSGSRAQAKGYVREILYAKGFYNDPRFQLVGMNKNLSRPWGNTDADILFRYGRYGLGGRVEVKDVSLNSQATDIRRIKLQIDKMAKEYRHTGQLQAWVNRRETLPEIKSYARSKGIPVFEKVSTGQAGLKNGISDMQFRDELARQASEVQRLRAIQGGTQLGFGLWLLWGSAPAAWADFQSISVPMTRSAKTWRRFGENASFVAAGSSLSVSGASLLGSHYEKGLGGRLYRFGRVGGVASLAALASAETFMIWRYHAGDISSKEFWLTQWTLGGGATGGLVGGWAGGIFGSVTGTPLGTTLGSTLGSFAGVWAGGEATRLMSDWYYDRKFSGLNRRFSEFVYQHYGVD